MNQRLRGLVRDSPTLQHRCELFAAGLVDNPCNPCDLAERRKLREGYVHKWSKAASVVKSAQDLPPSQPPGWGSAKYLGNGHFASDSVQQTGLAFLHIPPVTSRKPVEGWSIPPFSFPAFGCVAYPPENVLAVAEEDEK